MAAPTLVWLRNDLRLDDHEPLRLAAAEGPVIPVCCIDPRQFGLLPSGVPKTGAHRAAFLLEGLTTLRESLRERGGELLVRQGRPEEVLPALARETGARTLRFHEEVASEETTIEAEVEAALHPLGVRVLGHWGHTLYHVDDLPFDLDALPDTFTTFRKRVEASCRVRPPVDAPARIPAPPGLDAGRIPTLAELGLATPVRDPRARWHPLGGELAGRMRLDTWMFDHDRLRTYKSTRNGMLEVDDSSRLSPWLAQGSLSPRRVWSAAQRYEAERGASDETYWLVFELLWRDYFRFVAAAQGDAIFRASGLQGLPFPWRTLDDADARHDFDAWRDGRTGFPLVDAAMRELAATGWMSNRGRQNVVSFLTKNLGVDWRAGAEWFESQLLDYDVASNWGNWTYGAGVGNDARGFRFFNLHKQANEYDPEGAYVRHWLPELAGLPGASIHTPERCDARTLAAAGVTLGRDYPRPMVDLFASARENETRYRRALDALSGRRPGSAPAAAAPGTRRRSA
jgi:deoxyribodipyrimidine photo-lyase